MARRIPPEQRYWNHVEVRGPDECWPWRSKRDKDGYGRMSIDGRQQSAQRWAYRFYVGPLDDREVVRHTCDQPWCHNHSHWIRGTQADNVKDMIERGRRVQGRAHRGEANSRSRLTDDQVLEIRRRRAEGELLKVLAAEYGVSMVLISKIARREVWKHI